MFGENSCVGLFNGIGENKIGEDSSAGEGSD